MGQSIRNTLGLTFRVDLNLTPEFSIQYYGSPLFHEEAIHSLSMLLIRKQKLYDRFELYQDPVLSDGVYQLYDYQMDPDDYSIENPDFNFHEFRSNLVAKWEYRLGSFIYFVWSSERTGNTMFTGFIGNSYKQLRSIFPNNIFLIKLNYWFSL